MELLGDYRAAEAIPALIANIEFQDPRMLAEFRLYLLGESYPACGALAKIDLPALDPLVQMIGSKQSSETAKTLAVWTVKKMLGAKLAAKRLEIELSRVDATEVDKRKYLSEALQNLTDIAAKEPKWRRSANGD